MRIPHQEQIRPGDAVQFRYDHVGPIFSGTVTRVTTLYKVDRWNQPEEGVTVMTIESGDRVYDDITLEEIVNHDGKWRDLVWDVHALAGTMKPGFKYNGFTVKRVIFNVIADPMVLDMKFYAEGFCYVETPDGLIQKRSFDQVGE